MRNICTILIPAILSVTMGIGQTVQSKPYPGGIYIFCGNDLPKKFTYVIERKKATDTGWSVAVELKAPASASECQGRLMNLPSSIASFTTIETSQLNRFWERYKTSQVLDSLYAYAMDPRYQFIAGAAWFDESAKEPGTYEYRVSKKDRSEQLTIVKEERITTPSNPYNGIANPLRFKPDEAGVIIHYAISDTLHTAGIRLLRSKHKENLFTEVESNTLFIKVKESTVAQVTDATAAQGISYSYVAIPYDGLGNSGRVGDTLNIYNLTKPSDIGLIQSLDIIPSEEKKGMGLSWKLKTNAGLASIEIYRGMSYDGAFTKIASLQPKQTAYFDDDNLLPATSYFYYIVANASYGRSFPSARIPGILKGARANILPPQHLSVSRKGNLVTLTFTKTEADTRGYYIFRANSYTGQLEQQPRMLLSTDSALTYTDTLPAINTPQTYSYAVADINTSYKISPVSERVSVQTSGPLPVPSGVTAMLQTDRVFLTWKDAKKTNPAVTGFRIFRNAVDETGKEIEQLNLINTVTPDVNSFTDSSVTNGVRYRYQVQSTGLEQSDTSSLSQWASILFPGRLPLGPGQVLAYASDDNKAVIKWDLPIDKNVEKTRIYRSIAGQEPVLIKELNVPVKVFEDVTIEKNITYYYMLTSVDKTKQESKATDAVAVKIR
ncbi:MAG: hypothetical protein V4557_15260 [Bacteroidota bacterium]